METFRRMLEHTTKHHYALGQGLVTLLTVGGERIFSTVVFECPCSAKWNEVYGLVFLLVPALVLFLLSYVVRGRTWRLLTRCCARDTGTGTGGSNEPDARTCCGRGQSWFPVCALLFGESALAPLTWVAVALLGGSFYECAASGSGVVARFLCQGDNNSTCMDQLPLVPCKKAPEPAEQVLLKKLRAQSQIIGWILIAAVIILFLIITSITRCLSPVSYMQLKFWKIYMEQEQKIFKSEATEHAAELAKENVECFFKNTKPKECFTPSMDDWQQISSLHNFTAKTMKQYYSPLHKYADGKGKSHSTKSSEQNKTGPDPHSADSSV
ncbi:calcium homeostasis modulator protein 6-like [Saccopteryx bilineata]|uniref:calcium homeostasis modulator protein 6-like n=1 Tax=Saccopteryx bilineata TaxID=59482 RepID=UPI00338DAE9C